MIFPWGCSEFHEFSRFGEFPEYSRFVATLCIYMLQHRKNCSIMPLHTISGQFITDGVSQSVKIGLIRLIHCICYY